MPSEATSAACSSGEAGSTSTSSRSASPAARRTSAVVVEQRGRQRGAGALGDQLGDGGHGGPTYPGVRVGEEAGQRVEVGPGLGQLEQLQDPRRPGLPGLRGPVLLDRPAGGPCRGSDTCDDGDVLRRTLGDLTSSSGTT